MVDAELRDLVAEAVSERLDGKLAGAINAEERKGHAPEDRADVDDQSVTLPAHGRQYRANGAEQSHDIRIEHYLGLIGREGLSDPGGCNAGVVDEHIDATNMCQHRLHGLVDRSVTADVELDDLDALLAQCLCMVAVLRFQIAHRSEYGVAGAGQGFGGVTAETCAGASD